MPPIINKKKCIACGKCVDVCQSDVFFGSKKEQVPVVSYPEECWHDNCCVLACPKEGAIELRIPLQQMILYGAGATSKKEGKKTGNNRRKST